MTVDIYAKFNYKNIEIFYYESNVVVIDLLYMYVYKIYKFYIATIVQDIIVIYCTYEIILSVINELDTFFKNDSITINSYLMNTLFLFVETLRSEFPNGMKVGKRAKNLTKRRIKNNLRRRRNF